MLLVNFITIFYIKNHWMINGSTHTKCKLRLKMEHQSQGKGVYQWCLLILWIHSLQLKIIKRYNTVANPNPDNFCGIFAALCKLQTAYLLQANSNSHQALYFFPKTYGTDFKTQILQSGTCSPYAGAVTLRRHPPPRPVECRMQWWYRWLSLFEVSPTTVTIWWSTWLPTMLM